jgi:outer membrane protein OmpA-like peptidoglycan-associated protein
MIIFHRDGRVVAEAPGSRAVSATSIEPLREVVMINTRRSTGGAVLVGLALCLLAGALQAQTTVVSGGDRVVVEGGYVRIESPEGVAEVRDDWRTGGSVRVTDTDDLLVELGAVELDDYLRLTLAGDILFEFGSTTINDASQGVLGKVAQVIRDRSRGEILVIGHTDSVGGAEVNLRLSRARAAEVIGWLHRNEGIPARLLVGRGMGESQPVAHNTTPDGRDDPAGRARNRRVEIFVATTETADVREAALTVHSPSGDVRIDEDRVEAGGVVVEPGGVRVGGLTVSTGGAVDTGGSSRPAAGGDTTCSAGRHCEADCPEGGCKMSCSAGATCDYACRGGDCEMLCSAGAHCQLTCAGGDCRFTCALGSTCDRSCSGGHCTGG